MTYMSYTHKINYCIAIYPRVVKSVIYYKILSDVCIHKHRDRQCNHHVKTAITIM